MCVCWCVCTDAAYIQAIDDQFIKRKHYETRLSATCIFLRLPPLLTRLHNSKNLICVHDAVQNFLRDCVFYEYMRDWTSDYYDDERDGSVAFVCVEIDCGRGNDKDNNNNNNKS